MARERRAPPVLTPVTPGLARIVSLFSENVRKRAGQYLANGCIRVVTSNAELLVARIVGEDEYVSVYELSGDTLSYGCSCPFFASRFEGCKHLWALALEARERELFTDAESFRRFVADSKLPLRRGGPQPAAFEDERSTRVNEPEPELPEPAGALRWQDVLARARLFPITPAPAPGEQLEFLYFIELGGVSSFTLSVAQRKAEPKRPSKLQPAERTQPEHLAHESDRRLHRYIFDAPESAYGGYRSASRHRVTVPVGLASVLLPELAHSGRCRLVPTNLGAQEVSWRLFRQAARGPRSDQEIPPFESFLDWPLLCPDEGAAPWQLELAFESRARAATYGLIASLFRADERKPVADLSFVHESGLALLGTRLSRCERRDVALARVLAEIERVVVPANELEAFLASEHVRDVSRWVLPDGSTLLGGEAPRRVLELEAPTPSGVSGRVYFEYGGHRVDPASEVGSLLTLQDTEHVRYVRRSCELERAALAELRAVGFSGQTEMIVPEKKVLSALHELLQSGWAVFAAGKQYRRAGEMSVRAKSGIDWLELEGGADFEGVDAPLPELLRSLKRKQLTVELSDGTRGLLPEVWLDRWGMLAQLAPEKPGPVKVSLRQLGLIDLLLSSLKVRASEQTLALLHERLERVSRIEALAPPANFHGELRPYQQHGLGWLQAMAELGFGACLADDMGLGKTVQVLAHLARVHASGAARPSLIVVPRSLVGNWLAEAQRFAPELSVHVHWGAERTQPESWPAVDLVLTTYATLRLEVESLQKREFEYVVLDEAQAIKNASSATAKAVKLLSARQRLALTGTPIENHLGELWSLFDFLNPSLLAELPAIKQLANKVKPSANDHELIRRVVRPFVLRRTKGDVAKDLPARIEQTLYVDLEEEDRRRYDELLGHYRASLIREVDEQGADSSTPHVLEALMRLRQAACHPGLIDETLRGQGSAKVDTLLSQLESLREEGHKALVFSQFTSLLGIVRERLAGQGVQYEYLDGATRDRAERVQRFQTDASVSVFLISLKAGGVGLNLTAADYVYILDPWWNPAAEAQAIDRAHRIGQHRSVIAYRLLARATVEERVAELQEKKRVLVTALFDDAQNLSGRLSKSDLMALINLAGPG